MVLLDPREKMVCPEREESPERLARQERADPRESPVFPDLPDSEQPKEVAERTERTESPAPEVPPAPRDLLVDAD